MTDLSTPAAMQAFYLREADRCRKEWARARPEGKRFWRLRIGFAKQQAAVFQAEIAGME